MRLQLFLLSCTLLGCTSQIIERQLLFGTWKNTELKVKMNTFQNQDTTKWFIANEGDWEAVLQIKPIETTYFSDGTFESIYKGLNNQFLNSEKGTWQLNGDSLTLNSVHYNNSYRLYLAGQRLRFVSLLDWDEDGKKDDLYDGWQIKIEP